MCLVFSIVSWRHWDYANSQVWRLCLHCTPSQIKSAPNESHIVDNTWATFPGHPSNFSLLFFSIYVELVQAQQWFQVRKVKALSCGWMLSNFTGRLLVVQWIRYDWLNKNWKTCRDLIPPPFSSFGLNTVLLYNWHESTIWMPYK